MKRWSFRRSILGSLYKRPRPPTCTSPLINMTRMFRNCDKPCSRLMSISLSCRSRCHQLLRRWLVCAMQHQANIDFCRLLSLNYPRPTHFGVLWCVKRSMQRGYATELYQEEEVQTLMWKSLVQWSSKSSSNSGSSKWETTLPCTAFQRPVFAIRLSTACTLPMPDRIPSAFSLKGICSPRALEAFLQTLPRCISCCETLGFYCSSLHWRQALHAYKYLTQARFASLANTFG